MNKTWKVVLALTGIFVAGIVTGILIAPRIFKKVVDRRMQQVGGRGPSEAPQYGPQLFRRVMVQLDLTPEQRDKLKPIETRTTEELRGLRRETQRSTERIIAQMHEEIAAVLTPEQRVKFEQLVAKGRERIQKFMQEQESRPHGRREGRPGMPGSWREGAPREGPPPGGAPAK